MFVQFPVLFLFIIDVRIIRPSRLSRQPGAGYEYDLQLTKHDQVSFHRHVDERDFRATPGPLRVVSDCLHNHMTVIDQYHADTRGTGRQNFASSVSSVFT